MAQDSWFSAINFGRWRRGIKSAKITLGSVVTPPAPTPWIARPARSCMAFWDRQQTRVPNVKSATEPRRAVFRPSKADREMMNGWKVAFMSRNTVPVQKASVAVPWSDSAIAFMKVALVYILWKLSGRRTGSTGTKMVASSATTRETIIKQITINHSPRLGFQSEGGSEEIFEELETKHFPSFPDCHSEVGSDIRSIQLTRE